MPKSPYTQTSASSYSLVRSCFELPRLSQGWRSASVTQKHSSVSPWLRSSSARPRMAVRIAWSNGFKDRSICARSVARSSMCSLRGKSSSPGSVRIDLKTSSSCRSSPRTCCSKRSSTSRAARSWSGDTVCSAFARKRNCRIASASFRGWHFLMMDGRASVRHGAGSCIRTSFARARARSSTASCRL